MNKQRFSWKLALSALGPALLVAACNLGPGSVVTASNYGAKYGYGALWIILLSCFFAFFYQEPAMRIANKANTPDDTVLLGIRNRMGKVWAYLTWIVILLGSMTFQVGNLTGTAMALEYFVPSISSFGWACIIAASGLILGFLGSYGKIEKITNVLIFGIVACFIICAVVAKPDGGEILREGFTFQIPGGDYWTAMALLATSVSFHIAVGYSSLIKKKRTEEALKGNDMSLLPRNIRMRYSRFDLIVGIVITSGVTAAIVICSGATLHPLGITVSNAAQMAVQLEPLLGKAAGVVFSIGLFAAAYSTVLYQVTIQPYYAHEVMGRDVDLKDKLSKAMMIIICVFPTLLLLFFGGTPTELIISVQAITGVAFPIITLVVWLLSNKKEFMGDMVNRTWQNIIYGVIFAATTFMAVRTILSIFGKL